MDDFKRCAEITIGYEGGYSNDPKDPGGPTFKGLSLLALRGFKDSKGSLEFDLDKDGDVDIDDILLLKQKWEAGDFEPVYKAYQERYWVPSGCDRIAWPLNMLTFDAAVNHGVQTGVAMLQQAVGTLADGIVGTKTIIAVGNVLAKPEKLLKVVDMYLQKRGLFYYKVSINQIWAAYVGDRWRLDGTELSGLKDALKNPPFFEGWQKRLIEIKDAISADVLST